MVEEVVSKIDAKRVVKFLVPIIVAVVIAMIPAPQGLVDATTAKGLTGFQGMAFIGIFVMIIVWLILQVMPGYLAIMVGLAAMLACGVGGQGGWYTVWKQFSGSTVWTVVAVIALAFGIKKSGLFNRIALMVLDKFPGSYKGSVAGIMTAGTVIGPFIPSTTAKAAILMPLAETAGKALGYKKGDKPMAGFFVAVYMITQYLSAAFMTGAVLVYIIIGFLPADQQANWQWVSWFQACLPWFVIGWILTYVAVTVMGKPQGGDVKVAKEDSPIHQQRMALGKMSHDEKVALVFLAIAFLGWVFGPMVNIDAGVWSFFVLGVMLVFGIMSGEEFMAAVPWSTIFFVGAIFSLAGLISSTGVAAWFATLVAPYLQPIVANPYLFVFAVLVITYVMRIVIVSQAATVTILIAGLMTTAAAAGIDPFILVFVSYMGCLMWYFDFSSSQYLITMAISNDSMCEFKDTRKYNLAYLAIHMIACLASVPWWGFLGLC